MCKEVLCLHCGQVKEIEENKIRRMYAGQKVLCHDCEYEQLCEIGNMTKEIYRDFLDCKTYIYFDGEYDFMFFIDHLISVNMKWYSGNNIEKHEGLLDELADGFCLGMIENVLFTGGTKYGMIFDEECTFEDDGYERFVFVA